MMGWNWEELANKKMWEIEAGKVHEWATLPLQDNLCFLLFGSTTYRIPGPALDQMMVGWQYVHYLIGFGNLAEVNKNRMYSREEECECCKAGRM